MHTEKLPIGTFATILTYNFNPQHKYVLVIKILKSNISCSYNTLSYIRRRYPNRLHMYYVPDDGKHIDDETCNLRIHVLYLLHVHFIYIFITSYVIIIILIFIIYTLQHVVFD
jgi:hypothetical protein